MAICDGSRKRDDRGIAFIIPDFSATQRKPSKPPASLDDIFATNLQLQLQPVEDVPLADASLQDGTDGAKLLGFDRWLNMDLPPLEDLKADDFDRSSHSTSDLAFEPLQSVSPPETGYEDAWHLPEVLQELPQKAQLMTWEAFTGKTKDEEPKPSFLSEAGAAAFDAALVVRARESGDIASAGNAVKKEVLLRSLWQLGLGRESVLFRFDAKLDEFVPALQDLRASGYGLETCGQLVETFGGVGKRLRELKGAVEKGHGDIDLLPTRHAFLSAVDEILTVFEEHLMGLQNDASTLLQIRAAFEPLDAMTKVLMDLNVRTTGCASDVDALEKTYGMLEQMEESEDSLLTTVHEIFKRLAQPWLSRLETYVGLSLSLMDDNEAGNAHHPAFLSKSVSGLINEPHQCLVFVRDQQPDHPLVNGSLHSRSMAKRLELETSFERLERLQMKAEQYHADMINALNCAIAVNHNTRDEDETTKAVGKDDDTSVDPFLDVDAFSTLPQQSDSEISPLQTAVHHVLAPNTPSNTKQALTLQLSYTLPASLRPMLHTQHAILLHTALHSILHHSITPLSSHLRLHSAFSLFSSDLFAQKLSTVLFSPDLESAERSKKRVRTGGSTGMGLKLGGKRGAWPPASSEVQLALRGVLGAAWEEEGVIDSVHGGRSHGEGNLHNTAARKVGQREAELPGALAFAIRTDLPPELIEPILDPHSLHALDFLRLTYTPPANLAPLFTSGILDLYDRVFAFWLRMLRVTDCLKKLAYMTRKDTLGRCMGRKDVDMVTRVRVEAQALFGSVLSWIGDVGVQAPWQSFAGRVREMEGLYADAAPSSHWEERDGTSLKQLTDLHEHTLVHITGSCFCRKRQAKVKEAWEGAAQATLDFVRVVEGIVAVERVRDAPEGFTDGGVGEGVHEIGECFLQRKNEFVNALRAYVRNEEEDGKPTDGGRHESQLVELLDSVKDNRDLDA